MKKLLAVTWTLSYVFFGSSSNLLAKQVISEGWPGEYPLPVIKIASPVTLNVYKKIGDKKPLSKCTITKTGVYHPWATKTKASYKQISNISEYRAIKSVAIEQLDSDSVQNIQVKKGEIMEELSYLGEAICRVRFKGKIAETYCPVNLKKDFVKVGGNRGKPQQFFSPPCSEGTNGWVKVNDALFGFPQLKKGTIKNYGEVQE